MFSQMTFLSLFCSYSMQILGCRAVRAIGKIGIKASPHISTIVKKLLSFCDVSSEICSEVVQCLKDLLRKYPQLAQHVVPETTTKFKFIDDAEGKVCLLFAELCHC